MLYTHFSDRRAAREFAQIVENRGLAYAGKLPAPYPLARVVVSRLQEVNSCNWISGTRWDEIEMRGPEAYARAADLLQSGQLPQVEQWRRAVDSAQLILRSAFSPSHLLPDAGRQGSLLHNSETARINFQVGSTDPADAPFYGNTAESALEAIVHEGLCRLHVLSLCAAGSEILRIGRRGVQAPLAEARALFSFSNDHFLPRRQGRRLVSNERATIPD